MSFKFNERLARRYRSKADGPIKTAVLVEEPATYETSWGVQEMHGPHYRINLGDEAPYGSEKSRFEAEHVEVDGGYRKSAVIDAYQVTETTPVTTYLDGKIETENVAEPGDWIVRQPQGEVMVVSTEKFGRLYE